MAEHISIGEASSLAAHQQSQKKRIRRSGWRIKPRSTHICGLAMLSWVPHQQQRGKGKWSKESHSDFLSQMEPILGLCVITILLLLPHGCCHALPKSPSGVHLALSATLAPWLLSFHPSPCALPAPPLPALPAPQLSSRMVSFLLAFSQLWDNPCPSSLPWVYSSQLWENFFFFSKSILPAFV